MKVQTFQFGLLPPRDEAVGEVNVSTSLAYLFEHVDAFHDGRDEHMVVRRLDSPMFVPGPSRTLMIEGIERSRIV